MKNILAKVMVLSALTLAMTAQADTFKSGKFTYTIHGTDRCAVSYFSDYDAVDVVVPETVTDSKGNEYTVMGIDEFGMSFGYFKTVTLPSTIEYIEAGAYSGCSSLEQINIPAKVTLIGNKAFAKCTSLTAFDVDENSETYSSVEGVLFDKEKDQLLMYPCGKSGTFAIPEGVTTITNLAFNTCKSLYGVTLPTTLKVIGDSAFEGCTALDAIDMPEGLESIGSSAFLGDYSLESVIVPSTVTTIGKMAFANCTSLANVVIGEGVTELSETMFESCTGLENVTLPGGLQTIGAYSFQNCTSLQTIEIPSSVIFIGTRALYQCSDLQAINVAEGSETYSSDEGVLLDKEQKTVLVYPAGRPGAYSIPEGCTSVDTDAFWKAVKLTSVEIPATMITIGDQAFTNCSTLKTVKTYATEAPTLGEQAFSFIDGDSTLYLPEGTRSSYSDWVGYFANVDTFSLESGVNEIESVSAEEAEIYTLDGLRVDKDSLRKGGLYIKRTIKNTSNLFIEQ